MAKDPRFNFYPDNWIGGTEGFTLEQEGAYLSLIILQSKVGRFTAQQALDKLMQKTRGNTAVCTGLWEFLIPKFETDGTLFWSGRLEKEVAKSRAFSEKQAQRVQNRWKEKSGSTPVYTPVHTADDTPAIPINRTGIGNRTGKGKEVQEGNPAPAHSLAVFEKFIDEGFREILEMNHPGKDVARAIREAYSHLAADPKRLYVIDASDFKKLVNTWLSNMKKDKPNGTGTSSKRGTEQIKTGTRISTSWK